MQVPTVNVRAAIDGSAVVLTPLDPESEAFLASLLADLDLRGLWNFDGSKYQTPLIKDLFVGAFVAAGGVRGTRAVGEHGSMPNFEGAVYFFMSLSDDTDFDSRYRVLNFGYFTNGWLVSPDSTPQAIRLEACAQCKVCSGPLAAGREVEWKVCNGCSVVCPHDFKDGLGQYGGTIVWMSYCRLCGVVDPDWQPTGAGEAAPDQHKEVTQMGDASGLKPVVLIFEDQKTWQMVFSGAVDPEAYEVVVAASPAEAKQKFDEMTAAGRRIAAIVMDGALGGDDLNTLGLIRYIRDQGYSGPMIAASGLSDYRVDMVRVGCDLNERKDEVPALMERLLAA